MHRSLLVLPLLLAACSEPSRSAPDLQAQSSGIINGALDSGHDAVALLYVDDGGGSICSGTIVADRVYLTAAHCLPSANPNDYFVLGGTRLADPNVEADYVLTVDEVHVHPAYNPDNFVGHDIGVVVLAEDAPVAPYRWLADDPDDVYDIGTEFTAVGYGQDEDGDSGNKRKADLEMLDVYPELFLSGTNTQNICYGDSGGPAIKVIDGYYTVIGVHSFTTGNCNDYGGSVRTDDSASFIDNFAGPDEGTARRGGGGGGGGSACSVAPIGASRASAFGTALLGLAAVVVLRRRR